MSQSLKSSEKSWMQIIHNYVSSLYTRKNAQGVTDLQTSCNKVGVKPISGCVRTACSQLLWQVWNKLLSSRLMTVTDLLQVVPIRTSCYALVAINLLRAEDIRLVGTTCCEFVGLINLVPDLSTIGNKQCEDHLLTSWNGYTRKISHLVACLPPTSRQQVVFALLVPSCQRVWNKLLTTCNNFVGIVGLVARLFQQVRYSHDITILLFVVTNIRL
jgi:hypothetical protein